MSPSPPAGSGVKLIIAVCGIWFSFLYYGSLQEDITSFSSSSGKRFTTPWLLQLIEAGFCCVIGAVGSLVTSPAKAASSRFPRRPSHGKPLEASDGPVDLTQQTTVPPLPYVSFFVSGLTQVLAKTLTNMSMMYGLSFPVATLCKSAKMAPVMLGSTLLGKTTYTARQYVQVCVIILGTVIVGLSSSKKSAEKSSSTAGLLFILGSLTCDGLTGGIQKGMKEDMKAIGRSITPYQFMLYTNLSMASIAFVMCLLLGELGEGLKFMWEEPSMKTAIWRFAACSASGQSFIFYAISHFDPLTCTTITTTRKIFSVLLSLLFKGHSVNAFGWFGIFLASSGVMSEVEEKRGKEKQGQGKKYVELELNEDRASDVESGTGIGTVSRRSSTDLLSEGQ
ncbi:hypothetical protein TrST_g6644 [Triparma strigata]|uniref:Uncharacterized protein n=1 Tax=Triparma strigata TaxID=1606541 RepID=A0A9W7EEX3_9STRA|nr:hypothetical protein TrST_g6644 [Triparma strigata]